MFAHNIHSKQPRAVARIVVGPQHIGIFPTCHQSRRFIDIPVLDYTHGFPIPEAGYILKPILS
jgi:hypothetical protein